jgi:hypothetical protein
VVEEEGGKNRVDAREHCALRMCISMTHREIELVVVRDRRQEPAAECGEKQLHPWAHERVRVARLDVHARACSSPIAPGAAAKRGARGGQCGQDGSEGVHREKGVPQETVDCDRYEQAERTLRTRTASATRRDTRTVEGGTHVQEENPRLEHKACAERPRTGPRTARGPSAHRNTHLNAARPVNQRYKVQRR